MERLTGSVQNWEVNTDTWDSYLGAGLSFVSDTVPKIDNRTRVFKSIIIIKCDFKLRNITFPFNLPYKDAFRLMLALIMRGAVPPYSYVFTMWFVIKQHYFNLHRKIGIVCSVF